MSEHLSLAMTCDPAISAIYYALLQCGYGQYTLGRDADHVQTIRTFLRGPSLPFFADVEQSTCQVYPYWPRAAILESATRCRDTASLRARIMAAPNITDEERDQRLWSWLEGFPDALEVILRSEGFHRYFGWVEDWLATCTQAHIGELQTIQTCLDTCIHQYSSTVRHVQIILDPIKCVYSADYHLSDEQLVFCSGRFDAGSVIHEYLHHVIHPHIERLSSQILAIPRVYPDLDHSYYLSGDAAGQLNAFEEHAVRCLTIDLLAQHSPADLSDYLFQHLTKPTEGVSP